MCFKRLLGLTLFAASASGLLALNPQRALTQYTHTIWTEEHGLPQDTIHAITQTKDGYLWVGTDEGLAQFDGYEFTVFNKENGSLPSNSVNALWAASDGSLWIGTAGGLTHYRNRKFTTFTKKDGLADTSINSITEDRAGVLWVVAGVYLSRLENGKFTNYSPRDELPIESLRGVYTGRDGTLYIAGYAGVARREGTHFVPVISNTEFGGNIVTSVTEDRHGNLWGTGLGLLRRSPSGKLKRLHYQGRASRQLRPLGLGRPRWQSLGRNRRRLGEAGRRPFRQQPRRDFARSAIGCAASTKTPRATSGWE